MIIRIILDRFLFKKFYKSFFLFCNKLNKIHFKFLKIIRFDHIHNFLLKHIS